jgi:hypothetical protein
LPRTLQFLALFFRIEEGVQQRFDRACADFERAVAGRQTPLQNLATLIEAAASSR